MIGRYLADRLSRLWNQTIDVENRPGAGAAIGSAHVARSAPFERLVAADFQKWSGLAKARGISIN